MDPAFPGKNGNDPICISSRQNSVPDAHSAVTCGTELHDAEDVNQNAVEGVVNSYSDLYKPFEPANMVYYGGRDRIEAIQVPFAVEPTRNADSERVSPQNRNHNAQRAARQASSKRPDNARSTFPSRNNNALGASPPPTASHGGTNNMPNERLGVQAQGIEVSLPAQVSGLRRSTRKRNDAIYNEDLLANRLPRLSRPRGASSKKEPAHCLRMRASNHYPIDSDLDDSEHDTEPDSD